MLRIIFLLIFLSFSGLANADIINFKDGTSIEGEVISEDNQSIKVKQYINSAVNAITYCSKADVAKIEKKPLPQIKLVSPAKEKEEFEIIKISKPTKPKLAKVIKKDEPVNSKKSNDKDVKKEVVKNKEAEQLPQEKEKTIPVKPSNAAKENSPEKTKALNKIVKEVVKEKSKPVVVPVVVPVREPVKEKSAGKKRVEPVKKPTQTPKEKASKQGLTFFKPIPKALSGYKVISRNEKDFIGSKKMDRVEYLISVPVPASKSQLKQVFSDVLNRELRNNKSLDALWVTVYADGSTVKDMPRAYGIWSPQGGWDDFEDTVDKSKYTWSYRFLY
ncbi:MAG: hypothetical protein PHO70_04100 [Candidatus Omnitrophica bacterium]|nr:hypothetical protein [Candidatus Omnitrophota bacterium]